MDHGMGRPIRVLHVEDDASFCELVADLLGAESPFVVVSAASPDAALDRLASERFDCVLSDYDGDRAGAFRPVIEATEGGPPCVLLTGKDRDRIDATASAAVDDYVQKGAGTDFDSLTDRVRRHAERYRSTERHRALFEEGAGPMMIHDAETGRVIDTNPQYAEMLGYDAEDAAEVDLADVFPDEEPYTTERAMERLEAAADGDPQTFEWRNVRADGEEFPVEVTLTCMDVAGAGRVLATIRDISDRKRREAALEQHKSHLERLHTAANRLLGAEQHEAVYDGVVDAAESVLDPTFCALVIREENELTPVAVGGSDPDAPSDPIPLAESPDWAAIETGESRTYETESGTMLCVPLERHGVLCLRGYGPKTDHARELGETLASHAAVALDRAEREAQLRERSRRRDSLAAAFPEYVFFLDEDGVYQEVWLASQHDARGGRSEGELLGEFVGEQLDEPDAQAILDAIDETLATGEIQEREYRVEQGADTRWFEARVAPLPKGSESEVVLVARDITTQRRNERRLEAQNERLDEFASMVSHDLRNPLNVVQGRLELIESHAADAEAVREHVDAAESATERMNDLIEDMLTVARTDERNLSVSSVPLRSAAERAWSSVSEPASSLSVEVDTGVAVKADETELIRLLENLFRNSVEHGSTDDRTDSAANPDVTVIFEPLDGGFAVEDDGPGIPAEHREQVFESGYSTATDGTGYGLDIVGRVAEAHGWDITLAAGDGGARFEITGVSFVDGEVLDAQGEGTDRTA
ncbi:PAS domain S-box protein [Halolamina salifodinae]|uniref:histidine kinase n=1 Tax=Halolamina salifodinae TaxID=1202767 RepID=A0A8T4GUN0_9EURY|nr:PAS domain S-box protein [Halolamina salifodinae]MBP1986596.1 PAS domain S-box-containing protein [Halolamina salifodinae]